MAWTISIANLKGGIGKTTTSIQLAHYLAMRRKKVLVIDGDPDICATEAFGVELRPGDKTLYDVLTNPEQGIAGVVVSYHGTRERPISYPGRLDIIPGSDNIGAAVKAFEGSLARQPVNDFAAVPAYVIHRFCQEYDYVFNDLAPSVGPLTDALFFAADGIVAPVSPEALAKRGALNLLRVLKKSNQQRATFRIPGEARLVGILIAKIIADQEQDARELLATLDTNRIPRFRATIPYTRSAHVSPEYCVPIEVYDPNDLAAQRYRELTDELEVMFHAA